MLGHDPFPARPGIPQATRQGGSWPAQDSAVQMVLNSATGQLVNLEHTFSWEGKKGDKRQQTNNNNNNVPVRPLAATPVGGDGSLGETNLKQVKNQEE